MSDTLPTAPDEGDAIPRAAHVGAASAIRAHVGDAPRRATGNGPAHEMFRRFAKGIAIAVGSPFSFALAIAGVVIWAALGPVFHYSDTWQLVINTSTTIITFLVVFMIQNTQNRDSKAIHLKLDELIRALSAARNNMVNAENLCDAEMDRLEREFQDLQDDPDAISSPTGDSGDSAPRVAEYAQRVR